MFGHLEQYLDISDFEQPIKFNLKAYTYRLSMQYKLAEFAIGLHSALLQDSPLYSSYDAKNVSYVSCKLNQIDNGLFVGSLFTILFTADERV